MPDHDLAFANQVPCHHVRFMTILAVILSTYCTESYQISIGTWVYCTRELRPVSLTSRAYGDEYAPTHTSSPMLIQAADASNPAPFLTSDRFVGRHSSTEPPIYLLVSEDGEVRRASASMT